MCRVLFTALVALAVFANWPTASAQELPILRLKVSVVDADQRAVPVARYALLISTDPVTAAPRRVVTSTDGTAQVRLRAGHYTVESDRPFVFNTQAYEWVQNVEVTPAQGALLELTAANAGVTEASADLIREAAANASGSPAPTGSTGSSSSTVWRASIFELWTPHAHAEGFLADERGLVATSQRAIGDVASVEVQVSESVKVTGAVVVTDAPRDVAIVRVHPSAIEGVRTVPVVCDAPLVSAETDPRLVDVPLSGPAICEALAAARAKLDAAAPDAARLPVEPARRLPVTATVATGGAFSLSAYQLSSSDFDLTFITPALLAAAEGRRGWTGGRADQMSGLRVVTEFENWSDYVAAAPPLLFVRATPRLVEGFWMKIARGAASTQGAAIPPIKRLRPGFSRMRLLCGGTEVVPIHPFRIQARVTETDAIEEGFYVFDPGAIGPACGTVSIVVSSVKDPNKTETRTVDPAIIRRVWEDFARY